MKAGNSRRNPSSVLSHRPVQCEIPPLITCMPSGVIPAPQSSSDGLATAQRVCDTGTAPNLRSDASMEATVKARLPLSACRKSQASAGMAELADAADSKSADLRVLGV